MRSILADACNCLPEVQGAMRQLADYLQYMQTEDVLAETEKAKVQARALLEDQGVAVLALLLANVLADTIKQGTLKVGDVSPAKSSALS